MKRFRFITYDILGNVLFDATEEGADRFEALTKLMAAPWNPEHRRDFYTIDIFDRKD